MASQTVGWNSINTVIRNLKPIRLRNFVKIYAPIKALLESQSYDVKAEVGAADVVAVHPDTPQEPVIIELKIGFSLTLFHQAVARQAVTDAVYVAVSRGKGRTWQRSLKEKINQAAVTRAGAFTPATNWQQRVINAGKSTKLAGNEAKLSTEKVLLKQEIKHHKQQFGIALLNLSQM